MIKKKFFGLTALLFVFVGLVSVMAYAGSSTGSSSFDVSIDRVIVNGDVVTESKTNILDKSDTFFINVEFTALATLEKAHIEAVLRGRQSGDVVSDSTATFDLARNQSSSAFLFVVPKDGLRREKEFDLTLKIVDTKGRSEQKSYGIKFKRITSGRALDVSIDRVKVNGKVVAASKTNFIDESNDFDVAVEFTALEDLENAHVDAILKDLISGDVVADATSNFKLDHDSSSSKSLRLELLNRLKDSNSFELTIRLVDADGNSVEKTYGLTMRDDNIADGQTSSGNLDISIDSVEVASKAVAENEKTFVIISEGKKNLDVDVRLTSLENIKDAHLEAVLEFENGDVVADATTTFDLNKDQKAVKKLELPLIGKFEQQSFSLKVRVIDSEGDSEEKIYGLRLSQNKFPFVISSILLSPEDSADAGKSVAVRLFFKNSGLVPLDGVTAKISIPELSVSSTRFIGQIKNIQLPDASQEFLLKIPESAQTGTYTVRSEISSQFDSQTEVKELPIYILGTTEQTKQVVNDRLVIKAPVTKQDIRNDGSEVIYPLTFTNEGPGANTYTLLLDGANWAELRLAESNVFVLNPKESKTIGVYASSNGYAAGEQIFLVTIKSGDKVLKQVPLKGNVVGTAAKGILSSKLKGLLEIVLIAFVVFLAAIGLFFGVRKYIQGEESGETSDTASGEAYY